MEAKPTERTLSYAVVLAGISEPDVGRIVIAKVSTQNRFFGRPSPGKRAELEVFPARIRSKSGPPARKSDLRPGSVTSGKSHVVLSCVVLC